jgi:hypothetical protein
MRPPSRTVNRQKQAIGPAHKWLYIRPPNGNLCIFMTDTNLAYWGMIVVPIGVAICFGPALLVWLRDELRAGAEEKLKQKQDSKR